MAKDGDDDGYRVGPGKPPRDKQFKPNESGNPDGRPKGSKNFSTLLTKELDGRVRVTENGRRRSRTKRELIAAQLANRSAAGDYKAIAMVLSHLAQIEAKRQSQARDVDDGVQDPDDEAVIAAFIARHGLDRK